MHISSTEKAVACPAEQGSSWNISWPSNILGGHLADGKSGIRREWSALSNLILFIFKDFACWKQRFPRGTTGGVNSATLSRV